MTKDVSEILYNENMKKDFKEGAMKRNLKIQKKDYRINDFKNYLIGFKRDFETNDPKSIFLNEINTALRWIMFFEIEPFDERY